MPRVSRQDAERIVRLIEHTLASADERPEDPEVLRAMLQRLSVRAAQSEAAAYATRRGLPAPRRVANARKDNRQTGG